jgi:hypothetical protein
MSLAGVGRALFIPSVILQITGLAAGGKKLDASVALNDADLLNIAEQLEPAAEQFKNSAEPKKLKADVCSMENIYLQSNALESKADAVRRAIARRIVDRTVPSLKDVDQISNVKAPISNETKILIEKKQEIIKRLADKLKTVYPNEISLNNLESTPQRMRTYLYCSWLNKGPLAAGKLPTIELAIKYSDVKKIVDDVMGGTVPQPVYNPPTTVPVRPVTPPAKPAVPTLGAVRVLRNGKEIKGNTVVQGSKIEVEVAGTNLPNDATITATSGLSEPKLKPGATPEKLVFEVRVGKKDTEEKRTITVKDKAGAKIGEPKEITLKIIEGVIKPPGKPICPPTPSGKKMFELGLCVKAK